MMHKKQTKNALFQKVLNALFKAGKISEPWL
jgi:hypothetical protein